MENKELIKIGVYLECTPGVGGGYQYAQFILDAFSVFDKKTYILVAFYKDIAWEKCIDSYVFCEKYHVNVSPMNLSSVIDKEKCDLIICTGQENIAEYIHSPVVSICHDLMHRYEYGFPELSGEENYAAREHLYKEMCEYSAAIFVDSEMGKKQLLESYGDCFKEKVFIQPFRVPDYLLNDYRDLTNEKGIPFIFYPAQFWEHKNHDNLLKAIAVLKNDGLSIKLRLTGRLDKANRIIKLATELDIEDEIEILDYVSDSKMYELYHSARAMVMPTFCGPTNIPPIEAMFAGCPMVLSDVYAMRDQVGDAALYFNPKSVTDIAEKIKMLWLDESLRKNLIDKGRERSTLFTKKRFNDVFLRNIQTIICNNAKQYTELSRIIEECKNKKVYIYGTGDYASQLFPFLKKNDINVNGFIVSNSQKQEEALFGIPIDMYDYVKNKLENSIVILAIEESKTSNLKDILDRDRVGYIGVSKRAFSELHMFMNTVEGQLIRRSYI